MQGSKDAAARRTAGSPGPSTSKQDGEIDIKALSEDKIRDLMRRDPKFIARLISQLDKSMHNMMRQKLHRLLETAAAQKEIDQLNEEIRTHIKPNMDRLDVSIREKTAQREHLMKQIEVEFNNVKQLEADARLLIQKSRHTAGKLMRTTASQRLEENRGFSASVPTTTLIKGSPKKPA